MTSFSRQVSEDAFILSDRDVVRFLDGVNLGDLFVLLGEEIEAVYRDSNLRPVPRMGWSEPPKAREIMACAAADFSCIKRISSVPAESGSPTVKGTLLLVDNASEQEVLVCGATILTALRTAAASGAIIRRASPCAHSLGVIGAGAEGIAHALAFASMLDSLTSIWLYDIDHAQAAAAATSLEAMIARHNLASEREMTIQVCETLEDLYSCEALVTATFAEQGLDALKDPASIPDGTFIAAVGADLTDKRELPDQLYDRAKFIGDDLHQCLEDGELQYAKALFSDALEISSIKDYRGSLGGGRALGASEFLADSELFLQRAEGITIYDSAGFSGQDLAVARVMLKLLRDAGQRPQSWNLARGSLSTLLDCDTSCGQ